MDNYIVNKTHKLFYNCSAYVKETDPEIRDVLQFIYKLKSASNFTKELEDTVQQAKAEPTFKDDYMYFSDILEDEKEQARNIGLSEGRAEGLEEGRVEGQTLKLKELIRKKLDKNKTPEQIAEELEESLDTINQILSEIK